MTGLEVRRLRFREWGPIGFAVGAGECVGLSGESGCGKTLLLRAIADLDPHEGDVRLNAEPAESMSAPEWRRRVGFLPAESRWWEDSVGAHFVGRPVELLEQLGFGPEVLSWETSRLSAGERQRLALVRLLENQPHALLLDEPTANLDSESAALVATMVEAERATRGVAVLWVSHRSDELERIAQRRMRMADRRLEELAP